VEQNAATAKTLEYQAKAMDERVAFFRIAAGAEDILPAIAAHSPMVAAKSIAPKFTEPKPTAPPRPATKPVVSDAGARRSPSKARANGGTVVSRGPVARMQAAIAEAMSDPEWKEF
jgi:hypothetical protein